jgi:hypothetical protein
MSHIPQDFRLVQQSALSLTFTDKTNITTCLPAFNTSSPNTIEYQRVPPLLLQPSIIQAEMLSATLAIPEVEYGNILARRIASRRLTLDLQARLEGEENDERQRKYRTSILETIYKAGTNLAQKRQLLKSFRSLADNLDNAKALAIPTDMPPGTGFNDLCDHLLHLLSVALLAYRMGGPLNAGTTPPHAHQWKPSGNLETAVDPQNFYMEGDNESIFADHRITLVWEETNGQARRASGDHHIFLNGNFTESAPLLTASMAHTGHTQAAGAILYDQKNAALVYESQEKDAVRHSLSLDLMLQTADDDLSDLLATTKAAPTKLSALLLSHPIPNYGDHFKRLLFALASLEARVEKLSSVMTAKALPPTKLNLLRKVNAWLNDDKVYTPASCCREYDTKLTSVSTSKDDFLLGLSHKAFRDLHMHIGCESCPKTPLKNSANAHGWEFPTCRSTRCRNVLHVTNSFSVPCHSRCLACFLPRSYTTWLPKSHKSVESSWAAASSTQPTHLPHYLALSQLLAKRSKGRRRLKSWRCSKLAFLICRFIARAVCTCSCARIG